MIIRMNRTLTTQEYRETCKEICILCVEFRSFLQLQQLNGWIPPARKSRIESK